MIIILSTWLVAFTASSQEWEKPLLQALPALCENAAVMEALGAAPQGVIPRLTFFVDDGGELESNRPLEVACLTDKMWLTVYSQVFFRSMDQAVWKIEAINKEASKLQLYVSPYLKTAQNSYDARISNANAGIQVVITFLKNSAGSYLYNEYEVIAE